MSMDPDVAAVLADLDKADQARMEIAKASLFSQALHLLSQSDRKAFVEQLIVDLYKTPSRMKIEPEVISDRGWMRDYVSDFRVMRPSGLMSVSSVL